MLPVIDLGSLKIPSYILFAIIGLIAYTIVTIYIIEKKEKYETKVVNKILLVSILSFIILYFSSFIMNSIFHSISKGRLVFGGITWLGGVVVTFPITIFLIYKLIPQLKGKAIETFSLMVPGIVIGHFFGRIGCFLGGCCFGKVTDSFLGVVFPPESPAAYMYPGIDGFSMPVLPTQLFEACFELILFIVLIIIYKKIKNFNIEIYGISYSVFRFILEFFRGDNRGATGLLLSPSQFLCIIFIIYVIILYLFRKKKIFTKLHIMIEEDIKSNNNTKHNNYVEKLESLYKLYQDGGLNKEEYEKIKKNIIDNI